MPAPITDENDALDALKLITAPTTDPSLDEANELIPILRQCVRSVIWTASTSYYLGAVVQPTAAKRNGHRFELVAFDGSGVSSGATEPSWPSWDNATVIDGNITWQEIGPDYSCPWDLREAAFRAWQLKIDKVSCQYDFRAGDSSESMSQRIATLERQRDRYRAIAV
jgi:hypothetical protein